MAPWTITRRDFLKASALWVSGLSPGDPFGDAADGRPSPTVRFGIVADAHYADTATRGNRHYRESVFNMAECVQWMNEEKVDLLVELGDFRDENEGTSEENSLVYLETIEEVFDLVPRWLAQATPQFDAETAERGHLWMETRVTDQGTWGSTFVTLLTVRPLPKVLNSFRTFHLFRLPKYS